VVNVPLDAGHTDVEDEPAPEAVAVAVDDHEPAAGPQDATHLGDRTVLMGIVVEAIGTRDDVEGSRSERQAFAIPLNGEDVPAMSLPARPALAQHFRDQVDSKDRDIAEGGPEP
jgi:hypothetical protein